MFGLPSRGRRKRRPVFGTALALSSERAAGAPVTAAREHSASLESVSLEPVSPERSSLMNIAAPSSAVSVGATRWSLTRADMFLCAVPIALFLSIVSLV